MPVIPSDGGQQVLNAGAPVPIGSSADDRMFGDAISDLGTGLLAMGKRIGDNRDSLMSDIAADEYKQKLLKEYAAQQRMDPIRGDTTGFGAAEEILARTEDGADEIHSSLENEQQRLMFKAKVGNFKNDISANAFAKEVVKRAQDNELLLTKSMMAKANVLAEDPLQTMTVLSEIEASVYENPEISSDQKPILARKFKQMALKRGTDKLVNDGQYDAAKMITEQFAPQVHDAEEMQKIIDRVDTADFHASNREMARIKAVEALTNKMGEESRQVSYQKITAMRERAGNNIVSNAIVDQMINADTYLTGQDKVSLYKRGSFSSAQDDIFESSIFTRALKGENIQQLVDQVDRQAGFNYDIGKAGALKKWLSTQQDEVKKDPGYMTELNGGLKIIRAQVSDNMAELEKTFSEREINVRIGIAETIYGKMVRKTPQGNKEQQAFAAVKQVFGAVRAIKPTRGTLPSQDINTLPGIKKRRDALAKEYMGGNVSPSRRTQIKNEMNKLSTNEKIINDSKGKKSEPTDAGSTGNARPSFIPVTR